MSWTSLAQAVLALAVGGALACANGTSPTRSEPASAASSAQPIASSGPGADTLGYELPTHSAGGSESFPAQAAAPVAAETRLVRLSHAQYQHTVQDLFGIRESLQLTFAPDALNGFGFDTSNALQVDARVGPQYRGMAEALAERAVADAAIFARIVPCEPALTGCRDLFLRSFGERVFRRPLSVADVAQFGELFDSGGAHFETGDAFRDGVRLTLEALLQSPEFLYRSQASTRIGPDGRAQLDDFDVAARLAYFLYDSMPDAELLAAARARRLRTPDQIEAAVRQMLKKPRVLEKLVAFHDQAWQFGRVARISPDAATYPQVPKAFVRRVRQATTLFVRDILQSGGGLEELLTAPYAYADAGLAPLYGKASPEARPPDATERFARIDFARGERKGLLMQVGYLASNAYSIRTDPIHRGLFVIRNLLCRDIPDPPPGATDTPPPPTDRPILTTRDEVSLVTGQSFCPACHSEINPPGFAFEGFDAIGQRRSTENGVPVDTSASMVLDGQIVSFDGAAELVDLLARSAEAHRCYSRRWLEFAYGRPLAVSDLPTLDVISARSLPIADILVAIARSSEFLAPSSGPPPSAAPAAATPPAPDTERSSR
jgi:hypothetical protein